MWHGWSKRDANSPAPFTVRGCSGLGAQPAKLVRVLQERRYVGGKNDVVRTRDTLE